MYIYVTHTHTHKYSKLTPTAPRPLRLCQVRPECRCWDWRTGLVDAAGALARSIGVMAGSGAFWVSDLQGLKWPCVNTNYHQNWVGEHPNKDYYIHFWDVHQGYRVLTHPQVCWSHEKLNTTHIHVRYESGTWRVWDWIRFGSVFFVFHILMKIQVWRKSISLTIAMQSLAATGWSLRWWQAAGERRGRNPAPPGIVETL